jgi:DNA mismatch repair protein MutS2
MFELGDVVKIKSSNLIGVICRKKRTNNNYEYIVLINNNKLKISEERLEKFNNNNNNNNNNNTNNYRTFSKKQHITYDIFENTNFNNEIMLRHQNVNEALETLEKFIDSAICNNVCVIKIIHGKHGGVLRKVVHEYLKNSEYISEYRLGYHHEGSYGVTIAKIKLN